jgi:effector-binding domain-containing protein
MVKRMDYKVEITEVTEHPIAAARQRTTFKRIAAEIGRLLESPWALIRRRPELRTGGHNVAMYWNANGEGSIEVGVQVVKRFEDTDTVVCSSTPAGRAAMTTHFGEYSDLGSVHEAVFAWCKRNGHELAGPFWEVYGDWDDDPLKRQTDVFYLLR